MTDKDKLNLLDSDIRRIAISMTLCASELEMSARILDLYGDSDVADALDGIAEKIREERNKFCYDNRRTQR